MIRKIQREAQKSVKIIPTAREEQGRPAFTLSSADEGSPVRIQKLMKAGQPRKERDEDVDLSGMIRR